MKEKAAEETHSKMLLKYNGKEVEVLGTTYIINISFDDAQLIEDSSVEGYCSLYTHRICIEDFRRLHKYRNRSDEWIEALTKQVIRHELIHAFFNESGLSYATSDSNGPWAINEEMVDWIAIQFPKISKLFTELDLM